MADIVDEMGVWTSRFAYVWIQIKHIIMSNSHQLGIVGHGSETQL